MLNDREKCAMKYCLVLATPCKSDCLLFCCVVKPAAIEKKLFLIPPGYMFIYINNSYLYIR